MSNFKRGQIQILRGGNPILNIGKANYQGGGESTPSPPEINPDISMGEALEYVLQKFPRIFLCENGQL